MADTRMQNRLNATKATLTRIRKWRHKVDSSLTALIVAVAVLFICVATGFLCQIKFAPKSPFPSVSPTNAPATAGGTVFFIGIVIKYNEHEAVPINEVND